MVFKKNKLFLLNFYFIFKLFKGKQTVYLTEKWLKQYKKRMYPTNRDNIDPRKKEYRRVQMSKGEGGEKSLTRQ